MLIEERHDFDFFMIVSLRNMFEKEFDISEIEMFIYSFNQLYDKLKPSPTKSKIFNSLDREINDLSRINIDFRIDSNYFENIIKLFNKHLVKSNIKEFPELNTVDFIYKKAFDYSFGRQTYITSCMVDWTKLTLNHLEKDTKDYCIKTIVDRYNILHNIDKPAWDKVKTLLEIGTDCKFYKLFAESQEIDGNVLDQL